MSAMFPTMPLSAEELRALLSYDPDTGVFRRRYAGGGLAVGDVAGATHPTGYRTIQVVGRRHYAHRLAWYYVTGEWPKEIDHINGDRSDNRFANLRTASRLQNMANQDRHRDSASPFKGVTFEPRTGRWFVRIQVNKKRKCLGTFDTAEEAYAVYVAAAKRLNGEFARSE